MKKTWLLFFLITVFSIQAYASDFEERKLSAFHNITVERGVTVILIHADRNKANIKADGIALSEVVTDLSVFSLTVKLKNYNPNASVVVEIFYTDALDEITTENGVTILSQGAIYSDKLSVNARFGGVIRIEIETREIEIQASGAMVTLAGRTYKLNVYALKDAVADCSALAYTTKKVSVSGNGIVKLKE
jgi:hypothetical protein